MKDVVEACNSGGKERGRRSSQCCHDESCTPLTGSGNSDSGAVRSTQGICQNGKKIRSESGTQVASGPGETLFGRRFMFLTTRNYSREPGSGFSQLSDRIQRVLNETLGGLDWQYRDSAAASWVPAVDVFEEKDAIRIAAEIPGV